MSRSPLRLLRTATSLAVASLAVIGVLAPAAANAQSVPRGATLGAAPSTGATLLTLDDWTLSKMRNGTDSCSTTTFTKGVTLTIRTGEEASYRKRFTCGSLQVRLDYLVTGSSDGYRGTTMPRTTEVRVLMSAIADAQVCGSTVVTYYRSGDQNPSGSAYEVRRHIQANPIGNALPACKGFKPVIEYTEGAQRV